MSTTELAWNDAFLLGYGPMDDTHREFVDRVQAVLSASDSDVSVAFSALVEHLETHFEQEKQWMVSTSFPPADCHVQEHDAVLNSAHQVAELLSNQGDVAVARSMVEELARWFPGHADYLDASLAQWMAKRSYGGVPVVLRRNISFAADDAQE